MKKSFILFSTVAATLLSAQTIDSITYKNLSRISEKIANETIDLNIGSEFNAKNINKSLQKFYNFNYFDDIQVYNNNGALEFVFTEKPSIANIEVKGYKTSKDDLDSLFFSMGIKKGSMYTKDRVLRAKKSLLLSLEREGYINSVVEVETINLNKDAISLIFNVNKGDEILIRKVNYFGAKYLNQDNFDEVTANKEKEIVSWWFGQNTGELKLNQISYESRRINDLYYQHGFLDAKVEDPFMTIDFASNEAILNFNIIENDQYLTNDIKIYADSSILDVNSLYEELDLEKDDVFNINKLRKDISFIKTQFANLGYAFVEVKYDLKKDSINHKVNIVFNVIPGEKVYINDVIISGNTRTLDRVIRRNVFLAPKDLYNLTDLKDSKNRLGRSGFFENIIIKEQRISSNKINLLIEVKEAATGNLIIGGGYGSYDGAMFNASINDKNIFGSGLNLGFSVDLSKRKTNFTVSLKNPALNDSKYNGEISAYNKKSKYSNTKYDLDTNITGFGIGVGRNYFRNVYAGLRYKYEDVSEEYSNAKVEKKDNKYVLSSITPYISYNTTDDYYVPREGIIAGISYEIAGIGGDAKFHKLSTYFKYFYGFNDVLDYDMIFKYKTNIRMLFDKGRITEGQSFYLGGPRSLRGYESYSFSPDFLEAEVLKKTFTNSVELSFPLIPSAKMRWGIFYDYGMIGENSFDQLKRSGAGALIEWISPVGPLQFIFSKALDAKKTDKTSNFEFSLGTSF
ncbi:MAG: outer membrane protein assembly factor BamA [Campylobacteraceae bacterium]|nr:outer membrane protein assembly factor BamA [Campylobacteraceae bacterium]